MSPSDPVALGLPHRAPFIFVDEVRAHVPGESAECAKTFPPAEPFFAGHFPGDPLVPGAWDIPVPVDSAPEVLPDVLRVPMLAFDRKGFRLGYGGGFYDRTLEKLRELKKVVAIGVAYHAQMVGEVPVGIHDAPLDYVMTEQETFACA